MNATIKNKKVTVIFRESFATIEKLVKLAKQGIAEVGLAEFKSAIIFSKDEYFQSIKKEPLKALFLKMVDVSERHSNIFTSFLLR